MSAERRRQLELLQGRLKEAKADFEAPHTEGYAEELKQLIEDAIAIEAEAVVREREARDTTRQLAAFRHDVEEAERQLLAPKAVSSVGPATALLTVASGVAGAMTLVTLLSGAPTLGGYLVLGVLALV
ncbi:MAG: hypothetical protein H6Q89_3209, partial [Myxococcaceae bacterium]|nr:hypothetical protein [Myxococcaceae bacterium]